MNENIDLTKILKECPKGWKLYSPIFGEIDFSKICDDVYAIVTIQDCRTVSFTKEGFYYADVDGECLLSKDQRDWSKFTAPWLKKERDIIAWLKEQGEQEEPQVYETEDGKIITYSETDGYKFDEPKFHKGQWIACKGLNTALIIGIVDNKYEVEFFDGNKGFPYIDYVDRLVERVLMEGKVCGCGKHYRYFSQFNVNGEELMATAKTYEKDIIFEVYKGKN